MSDDQTPASPDAPTETEDARRDQIDLARYEGIDGAVVRELSGCERELLAVVDRAEYDRTLDEEAKALARTVTVKGFRKGKVPPARVKALHAQELHERTVKRLVNEIWQGVQEEQGVRAIASPTLTEVALRDGEPLRFAARFEVLPQVELRGLDGIEVEDKSVKVTDEDVEREIEGLRASRAELVPLDKSEVDPGDHAVINLDRWAAGVERQAADPEERREGLVIEVGAEGNMPELDRALLGMSIGEIRPFESRYPDDHSDGELAGKTVAFQVLLKEVLEKKIPELTDELAREAGPWKTVEELRGAVRERLLEIRQEAARREQDQQVVEQLLSANPVEMPRALVDQEGEARIRAALQDLAARGVDPETLKVDWKAEFDRARSAAERDLKVDYLLDLVAREREVEVSDDDVTAEIARLAAARNTTPQAVSAQLKKSSQMSQLRASLRRRSTLDLLKSGATISAE